MIAHSVSSHAPLMLLSGSVRRARTAVTAASMRLGWREGGRREGGREGGRREGGGSKGGEERQQEKGEREGGWEEGE